MWVLGLVEVALSQAIDASVVDAVKSLTHSRSVAARFAF